MERAYILDTFVAVEEVVRDATGAAGHTVVGLDLRHVLARASALPTNNKFKNVRGFLAEFSRNSATQKVENHTFFESAIH